MQNERSLAAVPLEEKVKIAAEVRESLLAAAKLNHERFGLNLGEAKALAFHVTKKSVGSVIAVTNRCRAKCRPVGNAVQPDAQPG